MALGGSRNLPRHRPSQHQARQLIHSPLHATPRTLSDADLDLAAKAVLKGGFSFSGQRCTAVKLVLVMRDVADALAAKVRATSFPWVTGLRTLMRDALGAVLRGAW